MSDSDQFANEEFEDEFEENGGGWTDDENDDLFDDDFEEYDENNNNGQENQTELSPEIKIENGFHTAYYEINDDAENALNSFLNVIKLCNEYDYDNADNSQLQNISEFKFKSLHEMVKLYFNFNKYDETITNYKLLLSLSSHIKPNDISRTIRSILNTVKMNESIYDEMFRLTIEYLENQNKALDHLRFDLIIERCHELLSNSMYSECKKWIEQLHSNFVFNNSSQNATKGAQLLQVYAVKILLNMALIEEAKNNNDDEEHKSLKWELMQIIDESRKIINSGIEDAKSMCIIYECWGKMHSSLNDWFNAFQYFQKSFLLYSSIAHERRILALKYLLIAYMMTYNLDDDNTTPNPFTMTEIKVYENNNDIIIMKEIVNCFEDNNIKKFYRLKNGLNTYEKDPFIVRYLSLEHNHNDDIGKCPFCPAVYPNVTSTFQGKKLIDLVQCYKRVTLDWLCKEVGSSSYGNKNDDIERLIVNLIIDEKISGHLDQVHGELILNDKTRTNLNNNLILQSMNDWLSSVNKLRNSLCNKSMQSKMSRGGGAYGGGMMNYFNEFEYDDDFFGGDLSIQSSFLY